MKLLIETYFNDKLRNSRVTTQPEPNWEGLLNTAKSRGWKTTVKRENGKVIYYEEKYPYNVLGNNRYVVKVIPQT